jgi:hypothetical protein
MAIGLGVPCWSFGIQHLQGHLPLEGAAQFVRALGFDHTAVGWAHIDWPALRADPIAEAEPTGCGASWSPLAWTWTTVLYGSKTNTWTSLLMN